MGKGAFSSLAYRKNRDRAIELILLACALVAVFTTLAIVLILVVESSYFFEHVTIREFLTDRMWTPLFDDAHYGIMPLVSGTLTVTFVALLVAIPLGTIIAIYLSEFATQRMRESVKPVLELLGAVPTVVYGYFALLMVTPFLQKFMPDLPGFNMLSAGLVIGLMIVPYVASVSEDAMRAVPRYMREGSYAMGATRLQTALRVVVPGALSGIAAAYILEFRVPSAKPWWWPSRPACSRRSRSIRPSRRRRSPRTSCRSASATCRTTASATRASLPRASC